MSYNNTKLVAGLLGYALLACSISGYSFDSVSKTTTETSSESSSSATEITYLDADDKKVQLVLDSVNINCDTSATLYVKAADKVFVTLAADSDGFDAEETLQVDGGNIEVAAGDGTSGDSSSDTKDSSADNNSDDSNAKYSNAKGSNSNKKDDFTPPSGEDKKHPRTETPHKVALLRENRMALILPKTGRNHLTDLIKMITLQRIVTQIVIPTVNPQICRTETPSFLTVLRKNTLLL